MGSNDTDRRARAQPQVGQELTLAQAVGVGRGQKLRCLLWRRMTKRGQTLTADSLTVTQVISRRA